MFKEEYYALIRSRAIRQQVDSEGLYTELCLVIFKAIDATCLRSCKALYERGIGLLYEKIRQEFAVDWRSRDITISDPFTKPVHCKIARKPVPTGPKYKYILSESIDAIGHQTSVSQAPDLIICDQFLSTLFAISPCNCSLLKKLSFYGSVEVWQLHYPGIRPVMEPSQSSILRLYGTDSAAALRIYIPFIIKFCTAVETISLFLVEREKLLYPMQPVYPVPLRPDEINEGRMRLIIEK
ncbi:hypothetical protein IFR05_011579 [Cadophora sp. M221]|nr:hypothetical protein IFR05_011579 [Cadophora sp. M221]